MSKGRLSEAGIERLARRLGLECLWEAHMGSGGSMRTLIIAGSAMALDIDFANNVVKKVALSFPESSVIVTRHAERAGAVLLRDLTTKPTESVMTKMLDQFAANLERLAQLDKLSVLPGLNCHEAIAGIYESLEKLHRWEVNRLQESDAITGKDQTTLEKTALCTKSGKPLMHARDRLGLSLDYWQEKWRIQNRRKLDHPRIWAILVECAPLTEVTLCTPLKVSQNWISEDIQKANPAAEELFLVPDDGPVLDWLDPESTILPAEASKSEAMEATGDSGPKFPEVILMAKFDPPVVIPYNLAVQIYNSTNATIDMYQTSTFDGIMFPVNPGDTVEPGEARTINKNVTVPIFDKDRKKATRNHVNTLMMEKIDYGRTLSELPFSHPRQLVAMLPALRQYAFLSTLLLRSFGNGEKSVTERVSPDKQKSNRDSFGTFMLQCTGGDSNDLIVDVSLTTQPHPRLVLVFPFKKRTANIIFEIKPNGIVDVTSQNILGEQGGEGGLTSGDLGRMLEITEDLGIWIEYVIRRLG